MINIMYRCDLMSPSGYSRAARNHIRALLEAGDGLRVRAIDKKKDPTTVAPDAFWAANLAEVKSPSSEKTDVMIWHETPDYFNPDKSLYNIGYVPWETSRINTLALNGNPRTDWVSQMNKMDEMWTSAKSCKQSFIDSGVTVPIYVFPHPIDLKAYDIGPSQALQDERGNPIEDMFSLLSVFQWNARKNPLDLLVYYLTAFNKYADTILHVKTYKYKFGDQQDINFVRNRMRVIKKELLLEKPPRIQAIWAHVPEDEIPDLYRSCDVYMALPMGEGFGLPFQEAMACFPAGTLIESQGRHKPIEEIIVGSQVTTHCGNTRTVYDKSKRRYHGPMHRIAVKGLNHRTIHVTPEHPFFTTDGQVKAGDLTCEHVLLTPAAAIGHGTLLEGVTRNGIALDSDDLYNVIGWYLAEGYVRSLSRVEFSLGAHEQIHADSIVSSLKVLGCDNILVNHFDNAIRIEVVSRDLCELLRESCGQGSARKHLPDFWDQASEAQIELMVASYFKGDGSFSNPRRQVYVSTASEELAMGTRRALFSTGYLASMSKSERSSKATVYTVCLSGKHARRLSDLCLRPVADLLANTGSPRLGVELVEFEGMRFAASSIATIDTYDYNGYVYNFSVMEDESYLADGIAVHNCGRPCIYPKSSSMLDFIDDEVGYGVDVIEDPVTAVNMPDCPLTPWYQASQLWWKPTFLSAQKAMLGAYNDWKSGAIVEKGKKARKRIEQLHSYKKVGADMKARLVKALS